MLPLPTPRPSSLDDLLGPTLAARLDRMDVASRKLLAGKLPGERRSKRRGRSVEFADFRPYVPGDDLRHVDWNILGRLDKLFIKLFREEEDLSLTIIVDASASMDVGATPAPRLSAAAFAGSEAAPSKLVYACRIAMALGYVGLVNHNRVSIACFGLPAPTEPGASRATGDASSEAGALGLRQLAPMRGKRQVRLVCDFLLTALSDAARRPPAASSRLDPAQQFAASLRRLGGADAAPGVAGSARGGRGVCVLISDMLVPGEALTGLSYLTGTMPGTFDTMVIQTLSPGELNPAALQDSGLVGDLRLTDLESGKGVEVTITPSTIARYRAAIDAHVRTVRSECFARGIAHFLVPTDTPVETLMLKTLRQAGMLQ